MVVSKKDKLYYAHGSYKTFSSYYKIRMSVITYIILNKKITKVLDVCHSLTRGK